MTNSRANWLVARIHSEGYCCLNGYLRLCKARGEKPAEMADNIGMSADTLWYRYRKLDEGKIKCQKRGDCMTPIIDEIAKEKAPD